MGTNMFFAVFSGIGLPQKRGVGVPPPHTHTCTLYAYIFKEYGVIHNDSVTMFISKLT